MGIHGRSRPLLIRQTDIFEPARAGIPLQDGPLQGGTPTSGPGPRFFSVVGPPKLLDNNNRERDRVTTGG